MSDSIRLVAGIDGGATRTRAVLATADGTIIGHGVAGPSNYDNVGIPAASANIRDALIAARQACNFLDIPLSSIFLGMAGVVSPADRETVTTMVLDHRLAPAETIVVDHDIRIAHAGGLEGREGVVLIAGTGSSTYGRRNDGRHHRTGWGYLLDDGGSGYYLGLQAMIATVMEADGRGSATTLSDIIRNRFSLEDIDDILRLLYHDGVSVTEIASLAPKVIAAAAEGDSTARRILAAGARELGRMVETVARRLQFISHPFPVTMVGGLVDQPSFYRDLVVEAIRGSVPDARIVPPALPPVIGAVLLALQAARIECTDALMLALRGFAHSFTGAHTLNTTA